jgi:hypothetical protein
MTTQEKQVIANHLAQKPEDLLSACEFCGYCKDNPFDTISDFHENSCYNPKWIRQDFNKNAVFSVDNGEVD